MLSETKPERLLTTREVANLLKINYQTVMRLAKADKIPRPIKNKLGKSDVWRQSDIDKYIAGME
jgi:excisionase family DNA binding protein